MWILPGTTKRIAQLQILFLATSSLSSPLLGTDKAVTLCHNLTFFGALQASSAAATIKAYKRSGLRLRVRVCPAYAAKGCQEWGIEFEGLLGGRGDTSASDQH